MSTNCFGLYGAPAIVSVEFGKLMTKKIQ